MFYFCTVNFGKILIQKPKPFLKLDDNILTFKRIWNQIIPRTKLFLPKEYISDIFENLTKLETLVSIGTKVEIDVARIFCCNNLAQIDRFFYCKKFGDFSTNINCGGVKVPDNTACQWTIHSNILFQEIANTLCNVLMATSKYPGFDMDKKICNCSRYYWHLYTPRSDKEQEQENKYFDIDGYFR